MQANVYYILYKPLVQTYTFTFYMYILMLRFIHACTFFFQKEHLRRVTSFLMGKVFVPIWHRQECFSIPHINQKFKELVLFCGSQTYNECFSIPHINQKFKELVLFCGSQTYNDFFCVCVCELNAEA